MRFDFEKWIMRELCSYIDSYLVRDIVKNVNI